MHYNCIEVMVNVMFGCRQDWRDTAKCDKVAIAQNVSLSFHCILLILLWI